MQDNEKKPALRFKGFTDPWEQRKLGELVEIGDIDHRMPETVADGIPYLMTGDFVGTNELNFDGTKMISEEDYCQLSQKIKPEKGDILFARYASVGAARYVDFTRKFLISYSCAIIKKSKKINSKYLYHFITSGKVQQQIKLEINTGSQANIGIDSMKNHIVVSMPPLEEQTKIADALSNLDHLITLHQRKYEKLVNIKKSMLDKMFPKNGASVPEIRFKGFTDLWEQRKLGEMVDVCSGMDYKHLSEGDIPVYGTGGYMLSVNKALSYDRNAVGIGRKGTIDKPYILKAPFWTVDTLFYAIPKDSKNIDFTFDVFQKVDWKKKDESTGVPSLSKIAINETSISTPSKLEQERIGSFFRNLDTLITLHQREHIKPILEVKRVKRNE